jgi:hypothetical protein
MYNRNLNGTYEKYLYGVHFWFPFRSKTGNGFIDHQTRRILKEFI